MLLDAAVRGAAIVLAALFALAAAHKIDVVRTGGAAGDPLISSSGVLRRHPVLALGTAIVSELLASTLLVVAPALGYAVALALVSTYTVALRRLPANEPCRCFGSVLLVDRKSTAVIRNIAIVAVAALALAGYATGVLHSSAPMDRAWGIAVVLGAALAGAEAARAFSAAVDRPTRKEH